MNERSGVSRAPREPEQFIPWIGDYIFWSFYFSQGRYSLQNDLDRYAVSWFLKDESKRICEFRSEINDYALQRVGRYLDGKKHEQVHNKVDQVLKRSESLQRYVSPVSEPTAAVVICAMAAQELWLFDPAKGGPAKRAAPDHPRFGRSILLEHLEGGRDARHDVFRHMFAKARVELVSVPEEDKAVLQELRGRVGQLQTANS